MPESESARMRWRAARVPGILRELFFLTIVTVVCVVSCYQEVRREGGAGNSTANATFDFSIPIMLLRGEGFVSAAAADAAPLQAFLRQEAPSLALDALPARMALERPNDYQDVRAYMLYVIAGVWWVFGISWASLQYVVLLFYLLTAYAAYALFRLTLPRWLSALLTWAVLGHSLILLELNNLRDFSKTPFFLGVFVLLGLLLMRRHGRGAYLLLAAGLALITGVGLGFRQDFIVCVPPSLVVLMLFTRLHGGLRLQRRALALVVYAGVLTASVLPVPWLYVDEGSEYPHNVVMGMTAISDYIMGVTPASYERMPLIFDQYVYVVPRFHYMRNAESPSVTAWQFDSMQAEMRFIRAMFDLFPADMVTRGLAATRTLLRGSIGPSHNEYLGHAALMGACAIVLFTLSRNLTVGWGLLFLVLYFGAYPSLQFTWRHLLHYVPISYWFAATAGYGALVSMTRWLPGVFSAIQAPPRPPLDWRGMRARLAGSAVAILILCALPYWALWQMQGQRVLGFAEDVRQAERTPLATRAAVEGDMAFFRLREPLPGEFGKDGSHGWNANYLMARFEGLAESTTVWLHYGTAFGAFDFSTAADIIVAPRDQAPQDVDYYFPVYEFSSFFDPHLFWGQFEGMVMPAALAGHFKGLYRIEHAQKQPVWLHAAIPTDDHAIVKHQGFTGTGYRHPSYHRVASDANPYWRLHQFTRQLHGGPSQQEEALRVALEEWPGQPSLWFRLGRVRWEQGDEACAEHYYLRSISVDPGYEPAYDALLRLYTDRGRVEPFLERMDALAAAYPDAHAPHFFSGEALAWHGDIAGAHGAYRRAMGIRPGHAFAKDALDRMYDRLLQP